MRPWAILLLLLLPAASAQGGVYATTEVVSAPQAGTTVYTATDVTPTGEPVKAYLATSPGTVTYTTQWDYTVTAPFTLDGPVTLTFYIACDVETAVRPGSDNPANSVASARGALAKGGTVVSQADLYELRTCDGPDDIWEAVFELDGGGTDFAPGDALNLQLLLWAPNGPPGTDAQNIHVLIGGEFPSGLTGAGLPGDAAPAPAVPVYENLTGDEALVEHDWASSRNTTFVYNWTAPDGDVRFLLDVAPEQGNVSVVVAHPDGTEQYNATHGADASENVTLAGGDWVVTLTYDDFVGTVRLHAAEVPPPEDDGDAMDDGNETMAPTDNDSPAAPVVLLMVAVVAVAVAMRRRAP